MTDFNESFKEFTQLQADFLKPVREANSLLAEAEISSRISVEELLNLIREQ